MISSLQKLSTICYPTSTKTVLRPAKQLNLQLYREKIIELAELVRAEGGRAMLVGGCVRDEMMGVEPKDWDVEVYGVDAVRLRKILDALGMNGGRDAGDAHGFAQECGFFAIGFNEMDLGSRCLSQRAGDRNAGEAGTRADVGKPFVRAMASPNHSCGEQRLAEMTCGDLLRIAYRCQVHARVPAQQKRSRRWHCGARDLGIDERVTSSSL